MVLEYNGMKKNCLWLLLALFILPLAATAQETFQVKKFPYSFTVAERDEKCVVSYERKNIKKEIVLDIAAPCQVIRFGGNNLVIEHYYADLKATVVMFGGGLKKGNCKEAEADATQTLIIGKNFVKTGTKREGTCLPDGPDEKEFWLGSH